MDYNVIKKRLIQLVDNRSYFFKNATKNNAEKYLASKTNFRGLSDAEINDLMENLNYQFPLEFIEYLKVFGKQCGELFNSGYEINPQEFDEYQEWATEIIEDSKISSFLDDNTFVFHFHQGYVFMYFKKEGKDYSVYEYLEFKDKPVKLFGSFNELLLSEVEMIEEGSKKRKKEDGIFITIHDDGRIVKEYSKYPKGFTPREVGDIFI